ncbi:hypothetical protein K438DRAFT_1955569 [Mycena galopus ATCC 62051]|nr:hypothetical protein K438DRAFT_1955569 [Mycena galopus ATCC 62051]
MRRQYELTIRQEPKQACMCGIGGKVDRHPSRDRATACHRPRRVFLFLPSCLLVLLGRAPSSSRDCENAPQDSANASSDDPPCTNLTSYPRAFLQNPYYFMFASLAKPDDDTELHWLKDGRTRCTTGSVVSSLYALKDPTAPAGAGSNSGDGSGSPTAAKDGPTTASPASDAGFFVFSDLSVCTEGSYRLKLSLFEVIGCVGVSVSLYLIPSGSLTPTPTAGNDVRHCKSI